VEQQRATQRDVDQLHAGADAEHGHPPVSDQPHQAAIEEFAALGQRPNGGMEHPAVAARVEIGAPHEHHAVEAVENLFQVVVVVDGRDDHRYSAYLADRVVIARRNVGKTRLVTRWVGEI